MYKGLLFFILECFVLCEQGVSQQVEGVWYGAYTVSTVAYQEVISLSYDQQSSSTSLEEGGADSTFHPVRILMEFSHGEVKITVGDQAVRRVTYTQEGDSLYFDDEDFYPKGVVRQDQLLLHHCKGEEQNTLVLQKAPVLEGNIVRKHFQKANYEVITERPGQMHMHFLDEQKVIISTTGPAADRVLQESYEVDVEGDHGFIQTYGFFMPSMLFAFTQTKGDTLWAETFLIEADQALTPHRSTAVFIRKPYPSAQAIDRMEQAISGVWEAENDLLPHSVPDAEDSVAEQHYILGLNNDRTFELTTKGMLAGSDGFKPVSNKTTGGWGMSKSGDYLILYPEGALPYYLGIKSMEEDLLEVYGEVRSVFSPDYVIFSTIRLRPQ